jgi:hypothetical protein
LPLGDQVVVLARIAQARTDNGKFAPQDIDRLFDAFALPRPAKTSNVIGRLEKSFLSRIPGKGRVWSLTPTGRARSVDLVSDLDVAALVAESTRVGGTFLGGVIHAVMPPALAAPELLPVLREFLDAHPFERNVLGMTRFPDDDDTTPDPLLPVIAVARDVCRAHGLEFHLASDRAIHDDLWTNVAAHMWASQFGIAFFEDRRDRGVNYNLTIEVGAMLMTGRRCALLKDASIGKLPTDLVGKIYKSVDFDEMQTVTAALHSWARDDLVLGACPNCP